jgi:hypothetical protein
MDNTATPTADAATEARGDRPHSNLCGGNMANGKKAKLTNATSANVTRNIIGTEPMTDAKGAAVIDPATNKAKRAPKKDKKGVTVTKDGLDHGATVTVAQMRAVTDVADFGKAWEEFTTIVDVIEDGGELALVGSNGKETPATPKTKCVDGKRVILAGKDLYPRDIKDLPTFINEAIQAKTAAAITAFNNTFKSSYGGGGAAATANPLDDNSDLA